MLFLPSLMCADFSALGREIDSLVLAGADGFHLDIMDGLFVPNLGMGLGDIETVCGRSPIPCDAHLMVEQPDALLEILAHTGVKIVYVHPETSPLINSTLHRIASLGMSPGIVISPGTSFSSVEYALPIVDHVLAMTVNPGFAGQSYLEYVTPKLEQFAQAKKRYGYRLIVDGACSPEVIAELSRLGVDGAVLGTSALFGKGRPYKDILDELRGEHG